jgi:hypothetical protein
MSPLQPVTSTWISIVGAGNAQNGTQPHTDSRDLAFLGDNVLLDACDGGLYFIANPTDAANNQWGSFDGETATGHGLGDVEIHSIAWDSISNIIICGAQDNGISFEQVSGGLVWTQPLGADGADVAVDDLHLWRPTIRYFSFQNSANSADRIRREQRDRGAAVTLIPAGGLTISRPVHLPGSECIAPTAGRSRLVSRRVSLSAAEVRAGTRQITPELPPMPRP